MIAATLLIACALASTAAIAQSTPKIGVTIYKFHDTFMSYVRGKIESEAKAAGVTISVQDGQGSLELDVDVMMDPFLSPNEKLARYIVGDPGERIGQLRPRRLSADVPRIPSIVPLHIDQEHWGLTTVKSVRGLRLPIVRETS
jgi:hypothetical protein